MRSIFVSILLTACSAESDALSRDVGMAYEEAVEGKTGLDARSEAEPAAARCTSEAAPPADASTNVASVELDPADGVLGAGDSGAQVVALLKEFNRAAQLSCPCKANNGDFASTHDCIDATGYKESDIACLSASIAQMDSPLLRSLLACETRRVKQRNDCHEQAACAEDEVNQCDASQLECPPTDGQALTKALTDCPGASVLGR